MKQFGKILWFELKSYLQNKIFVGVTVFVVAVLAVVLFFPRLLAAIGGSEPVSGPVDRPVMLLISDTEGVGDLAEGAFSAAFTEYEVRFSSADTETVKKQILSGEAACAFALHGLTGYTYYVNNLSMYDTNTAVAGEVLREVYRATAMVQGGIPPEDADRILSTAVEGRTESLGKDQVENFFYTYIMIFGLYMVILLYGQMVANNVAAEKSSRAMELLITSARPTGMMFGKVIASCFAGLIQLVTIFGSALLFFRLNKSYWDKVPLIGSLFDMPLDLLGYMLVFFVLGFFLYAFLYGAIGSTASKLEDINTAVLPVTMLFIAGFFVVMFSLAGGDVDSTLMRVCSYIPFTSPMAMFTRIAMTSVSLREIAASIGILILSVVGIGILSARIYRIGVLLYGTKPGLGTVLKAMRSDRRA